MAVSCGTLIASFGYVASVRSDVAITLIKSSGVGPDSCFACLLDEFRLKWGASDGSMTLVVMPIGIEVGDVGSGARLRLGLGIGDAPFGKAIEPPHPLTFGSACGATLSPIVATFEAETGIGVAVAPGAAVTCCKGAPLLAIVPGIVLPPPRFSEHAATVAANISNQIMRTQIISRTPPFPTLIGVFESALYVFRICYDFMM